MMKLTRICAGYGLACLLLFSPCRAQKAVAGSDAANKKDAMSASAAESLNLVQQIKEVESPAFRAYLYAKTVVWLWTSAAKEQSVRRAVVDAAVAGISDIHEHQHEIPPAPASKLYADLVSVVRQHNPEEAARVQQTYPLQLNTGQTEEDKNVAAFYAALSKLNNPQTAAQGLAQAVALITGGGLPASVMQGEIFRLDQLNSQALPQLLSALLTLEEQHRGALPLQNLFFLSYIYLKETTPTAIQIRFLSVTVKDSRPDNAEVRNDPAAYSFAIQLLKRALPSMQKLTPALYAEASAQLSAFAASPTKEERIFTRIKESDDPLAETISQANSTDDEQLKRDLLQSAAHIAKEQGKLRLAVELITSIDEDRRGLPDTYSSRDEFVDGVLQLALEHQEIETARFAATKIDLPVNRAIARQRIARFFIESKDTQSATDELNEAARILDAAPDGKERSLTYFSLADYFAGINLFRASEIARDGVKAANNISRPQKDPEGTFNWQLFPLAESVKRTFQQLARKDRSLALNLSDTFQRREFRIAAALGVYSAATR
jgi:hypothetical protein